MRSLIRFERLSIKLVLAVAAFMLLLLVTVVTAVNLGLSRLQNDAAQLSATALTQQGRTDLQKRASLEATISNNRLAQAAHLTRIAAEFYQPELYRKAAAALGYPVIQREHKREGEHAAAWVLQDGGREIPMGADAFMDGRRFNPADVMGYLNGFSLNRYRVDLGELIAANPVSASGR